MRLFISPYFLLALASSSALALPLIASERDGGSGNIPPRTLSSSSTLVAREPIGFGGPGPALNSFMDVQPTTNSNNLHNDATYASCASNSNTPSNYLESTKRRRSNGPSDISERAAKMVTRDELFRHFFQKAVDELRKGKKGSTSH